jgi:fatty acid desaturase
MQKTRIHEGHPPQAGAPSARETAHAPPLCEDEARLREFAKSLDALRKEVEARLGPQDVAYIQGVRRVSQILEIAGRTLIYVSLEPVSFGIGVSTLWAHKTLELMEIGHNVLHGCYDRLTDDPSLRSETFYWKAPIDEASWRRAHNIRHHQYTNIEGRDPDLDFGGLRLGERVAHKVVHWLQPVSNVITWMGFANAINLHVTGLLDLYFGRGAPPQLEDTSPAGIRKAHAAFLRKALPHYAREFIFYPALAGPFFWKVLLGNALAEVGRDLYAGAIIYCGHVGAREYPKDAHARGRGPWYAMQVEAANDVQLPLLLSILCGGLDLQIEHHLFPRLPPNRLREIAPRVRAICEAHGVSYKADSWPRSLAKVLRRLRELASAEIGVAAVA